MANANACYLATSFGIVEYDLQNQEFGFTAFTDLQILDITSSSDRLFIATEDGIYSAIYTQNVNLADFGNWELLGTESGLPMIYSSDIVHFYNGSLHAVVDNNLMRQNEDGQFELLYEETRSEYVFTFVNDGSRLMVGLWNQEITGEVLYFEEDGSFTKTNEDCVLIVQNAIEDENGKIWFADLWSGVRRSPAYDSNCNAPLFLIRLKQKLFLMSALKMEMYLLLPEGLRMHLDHWIIEEAFIVLKRIKIGKTIISLLFQQSMILIY